MRLQKKLHVSEIDHTFADRAVFGSPFRPCFVLLPRRPEVSEGLPRAFSG
jgi:hypothetical protein